MEQIEQKAIQLKDKLFSIVDKKGEVTIEKGESEIGGGSLATESLPTYLVSLSINDFNEDELTRRLRLHEPPVITRINNERVIFDLRTIREDEIEIISQAVANLL